VADRPPAFRFLRPEFEADDRKLPSQAKQLHILVALLLNAGQAVGSTTLRQAVWDPHDDEYEGIRPDGVRTTGLATAVSRLRSSGWAIETKTEGGYSRYKLSDVSEDDVDLLVFDRDAAGLLKESKAKLTNEQKAELLERCRNILARWQYSPSAHFGNAPISELLTRFMNRHDELVQLTASLENTAPTHPEPERITGIGVSQLGTYLRDVLRRGMTLAFGNPSSWASDETNEDLVTLDDLWTPLRVADSQQRAGNAGTHESMTERDTGADLIGLADSTAEPLVILGDPGSGKSTSAAMLAARAARGAMSGERLVPIWVNLGTIIANPRWSAEKILLSGVPEVDLAIARQGEHAGVDLAQALETTISQGSALLLLDGLDEVKDFSITTVREAITTILAQRNGSKVLITCRTFDYRHENPPRKLPVKRELEILPLSTQEKLDYVTRWYESAARAGGFRLELAEKLRDALHQEILSSPVITDMAGLPLLLALLTLIHSRQELPDSRSVVCDQAIKFMLAETPPWRERDPGSSSEASGPMIRLAVEVAFRGHLAEESPTSGNEWLTHEVILDEATKIVDSLRQAGAGRATPSPEALSQQLENSHGLLLETGPNRFRFSHRYFQEYLAGQHFARGRDRRLALASGSGTHWREPFRLMASFAGHNGDNLYYILQLITELLESEEIGAQHLAAEMLVEITPPRLALWDFSHVLEDQIEAADTTGLWARARAKLLSHVESDELSLAERERSGQALASLGDRRLVTASGAAITPWTHVIPVKGNTRRIGTARLDSEQVLGAFVGPPRQVKLYGFEIGKYLVTNAAFAEFVADGGYTEMAYWRSRRARGWVSGDIDVLAELTSNWLETVNDHHAKEIRDGEIDRANLSLEAARRTATRTHPYYWNDIRFNRANQPVVGINYWEAEAFCSWATQRGHASGALQKSKIIAIPTEFEWECASRPADDDRIFPWGDDWDDERALVTTNTLNLRAPATVGVYPEAWPGAPLDLAGNVWEWTSSIYRDYSETEDGLREDSDSLDERVVRGGSWYNFAPLTACSARAVDRSYNLFYDVGFRIVVAPADSRRVS